MFSFDIEANSLAQPHITEMAVTHVASGDFFDTLVNPGPNVWMDPLVVELTGACCFGE